MSRIVVLPGVLTPAEAAEYLRLPQAKVRRLAVEGKVPGRQVDREWRFLKAALDDWLRAPDHRAILLQQAGALAGDETLLALRQAIYEARGRPEVEESRGK